MGYAFISYSTRNQSLADAMRDLLKDCGIETWMAPGDIPAGSKYAQVISRAVKNCSCFILMLSEYAQNSVWVAKEVERAISYRRPIIPVQLENIVLNDEFELYISTDQMIAIQKIDKETREIKNLLSSIRNFVGNPGLDTVDESAIGKKDGTPKVKAKNIDLAVWSPVNTDVFLNDKNHLVMRIDRNSGFDYKFNSINVSGAFNLIFLANGFEKTISFDAASIESRLEYRLQAILSKKEIRDSYDREEAIEQLEIEPTAYAFEQLSEKGISADVDLLIPVLKNLTNHNSDGQHDDYLIATCAKALGKLAVKYKRLDDIVFVLDIYENYEAKSSYGCMFDPIVKTLERIRPKTTDRPIIDGILPSPQTKKAITDGQLVTLQKRYPQYSDVRYCGKGSLASIYRAFDSENKTEIAMKVYSPEDAFQIPFFSDGGLFWDIKKLQADNLCPFIERHLSEPICLIMGYVQGETLEAHIKFAWMWNDNVRSILTLSLGILNGLNVLHSIDIYYGDLTPRNIIVDKNNVPWLCDFSESNYNGSRCPDKTVLLDKYRSPERSFGKNLDYRSDIYEFGVILSDFLPFIRHDDGVRDALFEIVKKATKENPDERFQSVSEIIDLLNGLDADRKANHVGFKATAIRETIKGDPAETSAAAESHQSNTNENHQEHGLSGFEAPSSAPPFDFAEPAILPKRVLPIILMIDTSGSMCGKRIAKLNKLMCDALNTLTKKTAEHIDTEIKIAVLKYSSGCDWVTRGLVGIGDFQWEDLNAGGGTDFGAAIRELDAMLSIRYLFRDSLHYCAPFIINITDGSPSDNWEKAFEAIKHNRWFNISKKIGIAIGDAVDVAVLVKFCGTETRIIRADDISKLESLIAAISVFASFCSSDDCDEDLWHEISFM